MYLSQKKLAARLDVAQSTIGMWESGKRTPKLDEINRIALTLKITVARLLGRKEQKVEIVKNEIYVNGRKMKKLGASDVEAVLKHISDLQSQKKAPGRESVSIGKLKYAKKILIIDDEQGMCELLYSFLVPHNYKVFLTFNGQMGLEYFDEIDPDVVLLDLCLPDINGIDVLQIIRKVSRVPVIVITAHPGDIADIHLQELHIDGYIEKPLILKQVLNTLKHIIGE